MCVSLRNPPWFTATGVLSGKFIIYLHQLKLNIHLVKRPNQNVRKSPAEVPNPAATAPRGAAHTHHVKALCVIEGDTKSARVLLRKSAVASPKLKGCGQQKKARGIPRGIKWKYGAASAARFNLVFVEISRRIFVAFGLTFAFASQCSPAPKPQLKMSCIPASHR